MFFLTSLYYGALLENVLLFRLILAEKREHFSSRLLISYLVRKNNRKMAKFFPTTKKNVTLLEKVLHK